jgi:hypothetical protein
LDVPLGLAKGGGETASNKPQHWVRRLRYRVSEVFDFV